MMKGEFIIHPSSFIHFPHAPSFIYSHHHPSFRLRARFCGSAHARGAWTPVHHHHA
jgi:hypothetical protein